MTTSERTADGRGSSVAIDGISRTFGQTRALHDVSLTVAPGRFLVLLGPSGSGKTTLLRALAGIETVDAGTIHLDGALVSDARRSTPPDRRDLGMVFQDYALWPHLTVTQNVAFALRRLGLDRTTAAARVAAVLDRVGLADKAERFPNELSGGQQQRVALARALVADPSLLLFDEPLSNLDADLRERMRVEISTLVRASGATAVYITHDQAEAFALADVVVVLEAGRIAQIGSPEDIYARPATSYVARFTGVAGGARGVAREGDATRLDADIAGHVIAATPIGMFAPATEVDVVIRSTALRIVTDDASVDPATHSTFDGTVVDVAYRGAGYDHVVESPLGHLTGVRDATAHPRGTRRRIAAAIDATFAFPTV